MYIKQYMHAVLSDARAIHSTKCIIKGFQSCSIEVAQPLLCCWFGFGSTIKLYILCINLCISFSIHAYYIYI